MNSSQWFSLPRNVIANISTNTRQSHPIQELKASANNTKDTKREIPSLKSRIVKKEQKQDIVEEEEPEEEEIEPQEDTTDEQIPQQPELTMKIV